ncbi:MAG: LysM peptidoglycan-binding domain-containing protein [Leifsonia sp.]
MNGITLKSATMPRLRLTKRGRRVLVALVAFPLVAAALAFALNGGMAAATNVTGASSLQYVTVESGQSLWQLASEIAPSADPRDVISDVVHLNQLTGTDIQAGQRLAIPAQYSH